MSARISLMYKRSGGCNTEHTCGDCNYCVPSTIHKKEFICQKHGEEETYWRTSWMACRFWSAIEPKPKKRKPRAKKPKANNYSIETTGQLQMVWE